MKRRGPVILQWLIENTDCIANECDMMHLMHCTAMQSDILILQSFCRLSKRLLLRGAPSQVADKEDELNANWCDNVIWCDVNAMQNVMKKNVKKQ